MLNHARTSILKNSISLALNTIRKAAYTLLLRTVTYNWMALLHKKKFGVS